MPEQNEGKEAGVVCLVKNTNLNDVEEVVFGKGFGVQGYDDGAKVYGCNSIYSRIYDVPILSFDDFKLALKHGQLDWHKVAEWQRWGKGYAKREEKIIILRVEDVEISKCFAQCGYKILIKPLPL